MLVIRNVLSVAHGAENEKPDPSRGRAFSVLEQIER